MSEDFNTKMKLLVKSEKALLNFKIRHKSKQAVLMVISFIAALLGLIMLNVTLYILLETYYGSLLSAAMLTGVNLLVAAIFFFIALGSKSEKEEEYIEGIRDFAWEQVSNDIDEAKQNITEFTDSVKSVKSRLDSFTRDDAFGLTKIIPIITALINLNKENKG